MQHYSLIKAIPAVTVTPLKIVKMMGLMVGGLLSPEVLSASAEQERLLAPVAVAERDVVGRVGVPGVRADRANDVRSHLRGGVRAAIGAPDWAREQIANQLDDIGRNSENIAHARRERENLASDVENNSNLLDLADVEIRHAIGVGEQNRVAIADHENDIGHISENMAHARRERENLASDVENNSNRLDLAEDEVSHAIDLGEQNREELVANGERIGELAERADGADIDRSHLRAGIRAQGARLNGAVANINAVRNNLHGVLNSDNGQNMVQAVASGENAVAVGRGANASGIDSAAYGHNAQASGNNSVALGANSVADQDNTVSVGNDKLQRRVTQVADGRDPHDAANVGQMRAHLKEANDFTRQKVGELRKDVNRMDRDNRKGIASVAALQMTTPYAPGRVAVNAGTALYRGQAAVAVGVSYWNTAGNFNVNGGVASAGGNSTVIRAGVGYLF